MSRGPGKVQRSIVSELTAARAYAPWPVWVTVRGLACWVYGVADPRPAQLESVRRACQTSPELECRHKWTVVLATSPSRRRPIVERSVLMVRLAATESEAWLQDAYYALCPDFADIPEWVARGFVHPADRWRSEHLPELSRLPEAVEAAAARTAPPPDVLELVNSLCGAEFGAADCDRWAAARAAAEAERERARRTSPSPRPALLRMGPYTVKQGVAPESCPCCGQPVDAEAWDEAVLAEEIRKVFR